MARFQDKLALVTGASRGIGAATAKALAAEGAHVILVARTVGGLEEVDDAIKAQGGQATLVPMDLRDHQLIDQLGATLFERWGKLDILVGNAGMIGTLGPLCHVNPSQFEQTMSLNVTANFRLLRSMAPLLHQAEQPRAVFLTDSAAHRHTAYWGSYAASKSALETMVKIFAAEQNDSKWRVNLFDPGPVATALRAQAFPGEDASTLPTPESVVEALCAMLYSDYEKHAALVTHAA